MNMGGMRVKRLVILRCCKFKYPTSHATELPLLEMDFINGFGGKVGKAEKRAFELRKVRLNGTMVSLID